MDRINIVSDPDDIYEKSKRIMLVDLTESQQSVISEVLKKCTSPHNVTVYVWFCGSSTQWLFDKIEKCDMIIFNAESSRPQLIGYIASQPRSYYFGRLQDVNIANPREIISIETITQLLEML